MANGNGKKTSKQLDGEINDIVAARKRRNARARSAARARDPQPSQSFGVPSQADYERRSHQEAQRRLTEVDKAPLVHRKEAASNFFEAMRDDPAIVAERVRWLLDGHYGYGEMLMAKQVLGSPRMNRSASLTQMIGAFEWGSPGVMTREAWKKLTKEQQATLERAVQAEIKSAMHGESAE